MSDAASDGSIPAAALPPDPPPPPLPPARRRTGGIVAGLLAALIVVLILIATVPYWSAALAALLPWGAPSARTDVAALTARLAGDEQKLATLEQRPTDSAALIARVAALEARQPATDPSAAIATLQNNLQALSARLDQSSAKLDTLTATVAASAANSQRDLLVALGALRGALESSRPFQAELATVEALGQDRQGWGAALDTLEPVAKAGLPSIAVLSQRFSTDIATAILRANDRAPAATLSWPQRLLARLRALVVIRRVDTTASSSTDPVEAAVAMAEKALAQGDLTGAVTALDTLPAAPAAAARPWIEQAKQRLAAEAVTARLTQQVAADLAAKSGTP